MTKSTITRERIQRIIRAINSEAYDEEEIREWLSSDEIMELSRMALAAMDSSESVELPLDYLQGQKDGLEWAAQLAEANHPETGDWFYDDPIELAKAIRKGPDMPPAQPVADSEPVAWTWHYREQWHVTNDKCRAEFVATDGDVAVLPLYRHAQPAPEYPETLPCPVLLEPGLRFGKGVKTSTMLASLARRAVYESDMAALSQEERVEFQAQIEDFKALIAQPAPVVTVIPDEMTPEQAYEIGYYYGDPVDVFARGANWMRQHIIDSTLAAAPQSPGSEPATVPGKWIPVSERMPDEGDHVLVSDGVGMEVSWIRGREWKKLRHIYSEDVTHWMPLPAAPQEVK